MIQLVVLLLQLQMIVEKYEPPNVKFIKILLQFLHSIQCCLVILEMWLMSTAKLGCDRPVRIWYTDHC